MAATSPPPPDSSTVNATTSSTSPNGTTANHDPHRRSSFGFLRRQKSTEAKGGMLSKKSKNYQYPPQQQVPRVPPQLPAPASAVADASFIGETAQAQYGSGLRNGGGYPVQHQQQQQYQHGSSPPSYGVPLPPGPPSQAVSRNGGGEPFDPYAKTESMAHRGRYSYASSAITTATGINSPRRVRRRKDPTPFK
jgi:hypothetical protein